MAEPDEPKNDAKPGGRSKATVASLGFVTMFTMVGFAYMFSIVAGGREIDARQTMNLASAQYVAGNIVVAGDLAAKATLDEENEEEMELYPMQQFLIGAGSFARAHQAISPRDRHEQMETALPYLERSNDLGFPDGRDAEGHRMLGEALHSIGRHERAVKHLRRAVEIDLTLRSKLLPLLARSLASSISAKPDEALRTIVEHLNEASLDNRGRSEAEILRIELLNQLKRYDDALPVIARVEDEISDELQLQMPWAMQLQDQLSLQRGVAHVGRIIESLPREITAQVIAGIPVVSGRKLPQDQQNELLETIRVLDQLQREAEPKVAGSARLLVAQSYLLLDDPDLALARLTQARQQRPFDSRGLEGGVSEIELLASRAMGDDVVQTASYLVREIGQSQYLDFPETTRLEVKQRIIDAIAELRGAGEFEPAVKTATVTSPVLGVASSHSQAGIAYRDWGEATLEAGKGPGGELSREASVAARERFRGAGDAFSDAAKEQFDTDEYVPTLWLAIESYQKGRHFSRSAALLEDYLRYEDRGRIPRALVAHGRALLADGNAKAAIDSLQTCIIEYDRDPMRYDARLLAAQAAADLGDRESAREWLEANLTDGQLTPQSPAWRDSLLTLGEMLFAESLSDTLKARELEWSERVEALRATRPTLQAAMRRLDEAVKRYWPLPRTQMAAYSLARGHLLSAELPEVELESDGLQDTARRGLGQKANLERKAALDQFAMLANFLQNEQRDNDLSDKQRALLRNSLIGQADTLRDMDRYAEAAEAYRDMSLRYMNEPASLEAFLGQSQMMRKIGREREADLLIRQANLVLSRIGAQWDDEFDKVTRYDRAGWERYLAWMVERLDQGAKLTSQATP
ncbi:tetratricopeptide repeat protein [Rhodopirellula halodulae]|uniref:tetratricopeptide repeat protein n=1 Tax=Rhodopirellula halodulae TaxID=2894198 RepID=UPI001E2CFEFB|nr:tetratricopeptide repeat protein [Rhodopirellula sp. JC737]MCC9658549.1 hypothetical protein [Rhodopirellula sp. JC737]